MLSMVWFLCVRRSRGSCARDAVAEGNVPSHSLATGHRFHTQARLRLSRLPDGDRGP